MYMETMELNNIKITRKFSSTIPSERKMDKCRRYFREHGCVDKEIVVNSQGFLVDGYVRYLVLKENDVRETNVLCQSDHKTTYVYGVHAKRNKEYCWRVGKSTDGIDNMKVGNLMIVRTRRGISFATITEIKELAMPPIHKSVRKVIKFIGAPRNNDDMEKMYGNDNISW